MYPANRSTRSSNHYLNTDLNNSVQFIKQFCSNCREYKDGTKTFSLCNECNHDQPIDECFFQNEPDNDFKLMEIAAKAVASNYPFQSIEERYQRIPEPVQRRIIYWSFPQNEKDIYMYSSLTPDEKSHKTIFDKFSVSNVLQVGFHLSGSVTPNPKQNHAYYQQSELEKKYRVSITFDRCKITSVTCSCDLRDIFWCQHVVALAVYRIRYPKQVKLRIPISETLLQLDKCQLQKLVQFLISEHHTEVLPTAQSLADKILNRNSILNEIGGAPDPTAGASTEQENCWHLDEQQVTKQVTGFLQDACQQIKQMNALFGKVKEMLKAKDTNASRMLRLITEQFMVDRRLVAYRNQANFTDKFRQLWDQLVSLWVYIALNPHATTIERKKISDLLISWTQNPNCPLEDSNSRLGSSPLKRKLASSNQLSDDEENRSDEELMIDNDIQIINELLDNNNNYNFDDRRRQSQSKHRHKKRRYSPRTIFHRALEASYLKWDDPHLKFILCEDFYSKSIEDLSTTTKSASSTINASTNYLQNSSSSNLFNSQGFPLWNEPLRISCARVEALRCHGYQSSALKLAVSIVRSMKKQQTDSLTNLHRNQNGFNRYTSEGWIGNQLDSISILFDTLAEASLISDTKSLEQFYGAFPGDLVTNNHSNASLDQIQASYFFQEDALQAIINGTTHSNKPQYNLLMTVNDSQDRNETYISLALEAALIGLGQQRLMPSGEYLQEKSLKQEERLIAKLNDIQFNQHLIRVLCNQVKMLLDGGAISGFGIGIHQESVPMHTFGRYLFSVLLSHDVELAYKVGLRAMRLPILEGNHNSTSYLEDLNNNSLPNNNNRVNNYLNNYPNLQYLNHNNVHQQNNNLHYLHHHNHHHHHHNRSHYNRHSNNSNNSTNGSNWHRWHVMPIIEQQQCFLATTMIYASRNDYKRLESVKNEALKHIHTSNYLFKLAQDAFKIAIPIDPNAAAAAATVNTNANTSSAPLVNFNSNHHQSAPTQQLNYLRSFNSGALNPYNNLNFGFPNNFSLPHPHNLSALNANHKLLEVAYELGLQVVKMTLSSTDNKRKEIVRWIVTCSTEIGFTALYNLMSFWDNFFTPIEAVSPVATYIMNQTVIAKLNLNQREQETIANAARLLAVSCARKDPSTCALNSLALCEGDQQMFKSCYLIVEDAGHKGKMSFQQLINVARYIDQKGCQEWAYKLCQLAIRTINIAFNNEQSPIIGDIHWACHLANSLGKDQLSKLVPILIENIKCAQVLSDILRKCANAFGYNLPQTTTTTSTNHHQQTNHHHQTNQYSYQCLNLNNLNSNALSGINGAGFTNHHSNHHYRRQHHPHHSHHSHHLNKITGLDKDPLKQLLNASINAYINTTHSRLHIISPRHYSDFVDFLEKAKDTFLLAADGETRFNNLIETIKTTYKGKKKLMTTIRNKFG